MYDTDLPSRAELPSSQQLVRSTIAAALAAVAILVTAVLPAEYGVDPTGIGRVLGLTEMGEIKAQLAREAEADRALDRAKQAPTQGAAPEKRSDILGAILAQLVGRSASAQTTTALRSDEMSITLAPGQGAEIKLEMKKGAKAQFTWKAAGGAVNCDTHGEPDDAPNKAHNYKKARSVAEDSGTIEAAFNGNHGWFWRNRNTRDVTITVRANGDYRAMKRVM